MSKELPKSDPLYRKGITGLSPTPKLPDLRGTKVEEKKEDKKEDPF